MNFIQYLNFSNRKLWQAITKIRINEHKLPIETGRYENKNMSLITSKTKEISSARKKLSPPFFNNWKSTNKISNEEFCRATLSFQNDDITPRVGLIYIYIYIYYIYIYIHTYIHTYIWTHTLKIFFNCSNYSCYFFFCCCPQGIILYTWL